MVPLFGTPRWGLPRAWLPLLGPFGVAGLALFAWAASPTAGAVPRQAPRALAGLEQTVLASAHTVAPPSGIVGIEPVTIEPPAHPLASLDDAALALLLKDDPGAVGPAAVGRANRGRLLNPRKLTPGPHLFVVNEERAFGTGVTVNALVAAAAEVERRFPGSPMLRVGDLSAERGGYIRPHRSHQTGLDADVGFYYRGAERWYTKANADNLDRARTWALVKTLVEQGTVEYVFVDRSVQVLLREHALAIGEQPETLNELFESPARKDTVIRHTWGHLTHLHVRFIDPAAEATGKRLSPFIDHRGRPRPALRAKKPAPKRLSARAKR